jgi:hypothetical protein
MATAQNDITGDKIASKVPSQDYLSNFDLIFRKNKPVEAPKVEDDKYVIEYQQPTGN